MVATLKLIRQSILHFQDARSDKVYEVDLCEVGAGQFVVNFRYGRRGSTLRDGTKTPAAVLLQEAQQIFESLVASKTSKGYQETSPVTLSPSLNDESTAEDNGEGAPSPTLVDPRVEGVLQRLREGHQSESSWPLSRAVWRAGEMTIVDAESLIIPLARTGDVMLDYCIAAALGRCGSDRSKEVLGRLRTDSKVPEHVRWTATLSLLSVTTNEARAELFDQVIDLLPAPLNSLARTGPAEQFQTELERYLQSAEREGFAVIDWIYAIDNDHVRPALMNLLRHAPLEPSYFKRIRRIYKAAELRRDAEVFGILAHRFEVTRGNFTMYGSWAYRGRNKKPTLGEGATKAFSHQTREYLRRRNWRTLARLGDLDSEDYVRMAVGVLLGFSDDDAKPVRSETQWVYSGGQYNSRVVHWDRYGAYWAFNHILYRNSSRYIVNIKNFRCSSSYELDSGEPAEREEAFSHLWERQPAALLHLLDESRCEPVHHFAVKVLRVCSSFCDALELDVVKMMIGSPYSVTVEFGLDLAIKRYNPAQPDLELVSLLAQCPVERARKQAFEWIELNRPVFFEDDTFAVSILTSQWDDTRRFGLDSIRVMTLDAQRCQSLIGRLVAVILSLAGDQTELAGDVAEALSSRVFAQVFRSIGQDVILDLLSHPVPQVQALGAHLVLEHETLSANPTEAILLGLLGATDASVRRIGVQLISRQPDQVLLASESLLVQLIRHERPDIRDEIRPTLQRLSQTHVAFGQRVATMLVESLLVPGAPEGVPSFTARILREDFSNRLTNIPSSTVFTMLQSRSGPAQDIGGMLLQTNVNPESLTVEQIVKLASHDTLSVREASWEFCRLEMTRLREEMTATVRLLDAKWEDSRRFGFELFREQLDDHELDPSVLVSICDSVRGEVQQFGREMITRRFKEEHGQEYLVKLSEHPTSSLQLFATNFLERYAAGSLDRVRELVPYFITILTNVNRGRVAKDRIYSFLASEAAKSESAARIVARLMEHISATVAIGDKAQSIEIMLAIHQQYSDIPLPITLIPVEVR